MSLSGSFYTPIQLPHLIRHIRTTIDNCRSHTGAVRKLTSLIKNLPKYKSDWKYLNNSYTWVASSLVGASTRASGYCFLRPYPFPPGGGPLGPSSKILFNIGTKKAAVLPDPV